MSGLEERLRGGASRRGAGEARQAAPTARLGADAERRGATRRLAIEAFAPHEVRLWRYANRVTSAMDSESLEALAKSLRREGQMSPGLARRLPADSEHKVEVVFGRRRLEACRLAGLQWRARVLPEETGDAHCAAAMHAENDHTAGVGPMEDARIWARYLADGVFARQEDLARALGVSQSYVSRYLRASSVLECEWLRPVVEPVIGDLGLRAALRLADALEDDAARRRGKRIAEALVAQGAVVPAKALQARVFGDPAASVRGRRAEGNPRPGAHRSERAGTGLAAGTAGKEGRFPPDARERFAGVVAGVLGSQDGAEMGVHEVAGLLVGAARATGFPGWNLGKCRQSARSIVGAQDRASRALALVRADDR